MKDFRTLKVWQVSHDLTLRIYTATKDFPSEERFGLTSQIRRSSSSIPANIAEGCGQDYRALCEEIMHIKRMLSAFIRKVQSARQDRVLIADR